MRRHGGFYGGEGGKAPPQMQQSGKSGYYQGRHQEQKQPFVVDNDEGKPNSNQWRWEQDGLQPKLPQTAMSPTAPSSYSEVQGHDATRTYYLDQRLESRIPSDGQGGGDLRSWTHKQDMDIGYEENPTPQTFETLEKRIFDDVMRLWEEKTIAEVAENSRHRERINTINLQYEEQFAAFRARHTSQREEFLRRESQARTEQYNKVFMEQQYSTSSDFNAPPSGEPIRAYNNSDSHDSYRERGRFPGVNRDHGYDSKGQHSRGRASNTRSRYYN